MRGKTFTLRRRLVPLVPLRVARLGRRLLGSLNFVSALLDSASAHLGAGDLDNAEASYTAVLEQYPNHGAGLAGLAQISARRKDWVEAAGRWQTCITQSSTSLQLGWFPAAAKAELQLDDLDGAEACYTALLKHYPNHGIGLAGLARISTRRRDRTAACERWRTCLELSSTPLQSDWYVAAAAAHLVLERLDEAEAVYSALALKFPNSVEASKGLARITAARQDWRTAGEHWNEAATKSASSLSVSEQLARARVLGLAGDFRAARRVVEDVTSIAPTSADAFATLASIAMIEGDETRAAQAWRDARNKSPQKVTGGAGYRIFRARSMADQDELNSARQGRADSPQEAMTHIKLLRTCHFPREALSLARRYADAFPSSLGVNLALATQLDLNLSEPGDVDELEELAGEIRGRFPDSRRAHIVEALAHVRRFDACATKQLLDRLHRRFGRCSTTDLINGWLAHMAGDNLEARRWSKRLLHEQFVPAVHAQVLRFEQIDTNARKSFNGKILLFASVKNERHLLPWFFEYYRSIGVDWFFIVDNASTDGSTQFACAQPDATVYWTDDHYVMSGAGGARWFNELANRHGAANWCIHVDVDEQLVLPRIEQEGLPGILGEAREGGYEVLPGFMLDMLPESFEQALNYKAGQAPVSASPFFDDDFLFMGHCSAPYFWVHGGARARLFGTAQGWLTKAPIVWGNSVQRLNCHEVTGAIVGEPSCALLHFSTLREMLGWDEGVARSRIENVRPVTRQRYNRYHDRLTDIVAGQRLTGEASVSYESSEQLVRRGLIGRTKKQIQHPSI